MIKISIEEIVINTCSNKNEDIRKILEYTRKIIARGAKKIVVKIPPNSFTDCIDLIRTMSTEFMYVSLVVYETNG